MTDALATVTPALTKDEPGRPDAETLRKVLRRHALLPEERRTELDAEMSAALARACVAAGAGGRAYGARCLGRPVSQDGRQARGHDDLQTEARRLLQRHRVRRRDG